MIRRCSATPTSRPIRAIFAPDDPLLTSYEGVLPGFTRAAACCPSTRSHGCPGWRRAASIPAPAIPTSTARRTAHGRRSPTRRRSIRRTRRRRPSSPASSSAGLASRTRRAVVRAYLLHLSPHPPFVVPAPYNTMYDPADGPAFAALATGESRSADPSLSSTTSSPSSSSRQFPARREGQGRATSARTSSAQIRAHLLRHDLGGRRAARPHLGMRSRQRGAWDDTIVILTSDHAEMMGDHFMLGKGGFFDGSYHIPLIVRDPRRQQGRGHARSTRFTEAVDILPTAARPARRRRRLPISTAARWRRSSTARAPADWRDAAHWEFDFRSIAKAHGRAAFRHRLAPMQSRGHAHGEVQICAFRRRPAAAAVRSRGRSGRDCATSPTIRPIAAARLDMAERLLAWRAEHLDQSLALCELTDDGVVGAVPHAAMKQKKPAPMTARASVGSAIATTYWHRSGAVRRASRRRSLSS